MTENTDKKLFRTQEVIGKHVVTLAGEDLGTISRVLVDPETGAVAGITLNAKGWFKGEKAIEFSEIKSIGSYAATIEDKQAVDGLNNKPGLQKLADEFNIYNTKVITPTGELMGSVDDFSFNADTGKIETFLVSGGLIKNLLNGKALIPVEVIQKIGPDVIVTQENAQDGIVKADPGLSDNIGSLKESLSNWKEDIGDLKGDVEKGWDLTLSTAKDVSKKLGDKYKEVKDEGKDKSKELLDKSQEFLSKNKTELVDTYEKWTEKLQNYKNRNTLTTDELSALLWKKAGKDIYDEEGTLIVSRDGDVSPEVLEKVQKANKTKELLLSIATRDVADKLETIEKESEEL